MPEGLSPQQRVELGPDHSLLPRDVDLPDELKIIVSEARARLVNEPYFEEKEVRRVVGDNVTELIEEGTLLAYQDHGDRLFPTFQFDSVSHTPLAIVGRINKVLDAPNNGWGATGWWIQRDIRLGSEVAPKELINDSASHETLIRLAERAMYGDAL